MKRLSRPPVLVLAALLAIWYVGMFARGYWTPDEPREADLAWRMSWQAQKAVPQLAGEAFCEKPPLTYWLAALPIKFFGAEPWAARLPNLLYALITALSVGLLARRSAGPVAGLVGAAAIGTFLLSYQVAIWLATDAPLLATVSIALLGAYRGFYAADSRERLRGYLWMHAALGVGFLCKSAVVWMVPATALGTLAIWENRWRELKRWELYAGVALQAAMIGAWIWSVYIGPEGLAHLKVFFWNNLVGRFTRIDAPNELQYAAAHRNSPGKYFIELPLYLAPWTLLVLAALRRAWRQRKAAFDDQRPVRFALAASLPALAILSLAATARNIYLAPALPGAALLLGWWAGEILKVPERADLIALRSTCVLLLLGVFSFAGALSLVAADAWYSMNGRAAFVVICAAGLLLAASLALRAWGAAGNRGHPAVRLPQVLWSLFLGYCALLVAPASQVYGQVDRWQDLRSIAGAIRVDAAGKPLILFAPDETTRAIIDMYGRIAVELIPGPIDSTAVERLQAAVAAAPRSVVVVRLPNSPNSLTLRLAPLGHPVPLARPVSPAPLAPLAGHPRVHSDPLEWELPWLSAADLEIAKSYSLPNGRRYALLDSPLEGAALEN